MHACHCTGRCTTLGYCPAQLGRAPGRPLRADDAYIPRPPTKTGDLIDENIAEALKLTQGDLPGLQRRREAAGVMSLHAHRIENARRRRNLAEGWETVRTLADMGHPMTRIDSQSGREARLRDTLWKLTVGSHARWGA